MTKITNHEDFTLAGAKRVEADIAAGRLVDFDAEKIKERGRKLLAQRSPTD